MKVWHITRLLLVCTLLGGLLLACGSEAVPPQPQARSAPASDYDNSTTDVWYTLFLKLVEKSPGWSPPVAARAFGYIGVTLYETAVPGMPGYNSLVGQLREFTSVPQIDPTLDYHWPAAVNSALATIGRRLFAHAKPEMLVELEALYQSQWSAFQKIVPPEILARSDAFGAAMAQSIYTWSLSDGGYDSEMTNYNPNNVVPTGIGLWVPTDTKNMQPLQPAWGNNRTFILKSGAECAPPAPPAYSNDPNSVFYREAQEVYQASKNLTDEQRQIAAYWADAAGTTATPSGHSIAILQQILRIQARNLGESAEAYAKLGIVLNDSFISCWNAKFQHNFIRPETFIKEVIDPNWVPLIPTPPFPEYPSGHSVQSGATAIVLTNQFGRFAFTDYTHMAHGMKPRTFASFEELAKEASISRLYGGIHYRSAIVSGLEQGRCVADKLAQIKFR